MKGWVQSNTHASALASSPPRTPFLWQWVVLCMIWKVCISISLLCWLVNCISFWTSCLRELLKGLCDIIWLVPGTVFTVYSAPNDSSLLEVWGWTLLRLHGCIRGSTFQKLLYQVFLVFSDTENQHCSGSLKQCCTLFFSQKLDLMNFMLWKNSCSENSLYLVNKKEICNSLNVEQKCSLVAVKLVIMSWHSLSIPSVLTATLSTPQKASSWTFTESRSRTHVLRQGGRVIPCPRWHVKKGPSHMWAPRS